MIIFYPIVHAIFKIDKRIVHPAKVPFVIKSEPAPVGALGNSRIRTGILRSQNDRRIHSLKSAVHILQKLKCISINSTSGITLPVYDIAYGVHSKSVKMIFLQPVISAGLQVTLNLSAGVIEILASPFAVSDIAVRIFI